MIHLTKMYCVSQTAFQKQRSTNTDKTLENQSHDAYHNAEDILAAESKDEMQPVLPKKNFHRHPTWKAWCLLDKIITKTQHKKLGNKGYK